MRKVTPLKRCKICDFPLRSWNKSGYCSNCWQDKRTLVEEKIKNGK
jgi:hypothetical protein